MRAISRLVLVAALLIGLQPASASAQRWTADWGINGGASWYSQAVSGDDAPPDGARFKAGWLVGSQLTFWPAANFGIRVNGTYTDRPFVADEDLPGGDDELYGNVNLWSLSGDLLIRLGRPNETWMGRETLPYLALGIGRKWVNPAGDHWTTGGADGSTGIPFTTNQTRWNFLQENGTLMGLVGLGADFRMSPRTALRLEVNDRIYRPRVLAVTGTFPAAGGNVTTTGDNIGKTVHEVGVQLGLHFLMGLRTPPPVAVAPPPPAPPPPPPPAPEPPREDQITVCVIDPSATGGIRMQTAVFRHAQRDTVVEIDGQRRPLRDVVGTGVPVARTAPWYVQGEPLVLTVNREQTRFLPYQTATVIEPQRIVYLGNVGGYPVYADRDEVADVIAGIQTARGTRTDADLGTLLAQDRAARDAVQRVSFLYVPLDPYGCVFQPVQRQVDVRKGGK
jgi:hypothetical protein